MCSSSALPAAALHASTSSLFLMSLILATCFSSFISTASVEPTHASERSNNALATCRRELDNANRTLSKWADTMEQMVSESTLPNTIRVSIHEEANKILDLIEDFWTQVGAQAPVQQLVRDLVNIRRRSNRMALDIYLNTFDMRWPQNSLQLGVIVERVQQACLDRASIQALESAPNPLQPLRRK